MTAGMLTSDFMLDELVGKVTERAGMTAPNDEGYRQGRHDLVRDLKGE